MNRVQARSLVRVTPRHLSPTSGNTLICGNETGHVTEEPPPVTWTPATRWPHYWSTYCMHGLHADCRLTCKICKSPCRCRCHEQSEP
jgi:hypothetical protein